MGFVRDEAKKIIDNLPDEASWDDVMYKMYVRKKIDEGLKAADEGRVVSREEVKKTFQQK